MREALVAEGVLSIVARLAVGGVGPSDLGRTIRRARAVAGPDGLDSSHGAVTGNRSSRAGHGEHRAVLDLSVGALVALCAEDTYGLLTHGRALGVRPRGLVETGDRLVGGRGAGGEALSSGGRVDGLDRTEHVGVRTLSLQQEA